MFAKTMVRFLLAAFVGAFASTAAAGNVTYNLVDYPANEVERISEPIPEPRRISGTIITDGKTAVSGSDILGGSVTFDSPAGVFTAPITLPTGFYGNLIATGGSLMLPYRRRLGQRPSFRPIRS